MTTETFQDIFAWLERVYPDKDAIADGRNVSWTFGELCDYSRRACAGYRQFAGLRKGDRIGWLSFEPTAALLSLSFGARKIGDHEFPCQPRSAGLDDQQRPGRGPELYEGM
jgi:acyl-CoA synthetase (AMP-forming)/AMP-acid ligase II